MTHAELLAECEKQGFTLVEKNTPKTHRFLVIARFERGLGPEYVNLKPVTAATIGEAQKQADDQAVSYFKNIEKAIINEVIIRPI